MSKSYEELFSLFSEYITKPADLTQAIWYDNFGEITWNLENNIKDLMNYEGDTYSENGGGLVELNGYALYTLSDSCGGYFQAFFDLSKKLDYDKYWDEQEEDE